MEKVNRKMANFKISFIFPMLKKSQKAVKLLQVTKWYLSLFHLNEFSNPFHWSFSKIHFQSREFSILCQ